MRESLAVSPVLRGFHFDDALMMTPLCVYCLFQVYDYQPHPIMKLMRFAVMAAVALFATPGACEEAKGEQFQFQADVNKLMVC